jgi:hypothetical protein
MRDYSKYRERILGVRITERKDQLEFSRHPEILVKMICTGPLSREAISGLLVWEDHLACEDARKRARKGKGDTNINMS